MLHGCLGYLIGQILLYSLSCDLNFFPQNDDYWSIFGLNYLRRMMISCNVAAFPFQKLNEAAQLYELTDNFNQAASCYIRLKNWTKVGTILSRVTSSKIHVQFAKVSGVTTGCHFLNWCIWGRWYGPLEAYGTNQTGNIVILWHYCRRWKPSAISRKR